MKRFENFRYSILTLLLLLLLSSCFSDMPNDKDQEIDTRVEASLTMQAMDTAVKATLIAATEENKAAATNTPTATASKTASPEPPPAATPTPTIVHVMFPSEPKGAISSVTDISTAPYAEEGVSVGDSYVINLFERPFTAEQMAYRGYLDIVYTSLIVDTTWAYVTIHLEENLPESAGANYGIEIDLDIDGRGDWLIWAALPPNSEWTTDGVGVYKDTDGDVGAATPMRSDAPVKGQNGYEEEVFLAGQGADSDAAWTRRVPEEPKRIQIAFKMSLLNHNQGFLWGIWASEGSENPAWFDYNDYFTLDEAGSPVGENSAYPLKALALLDNTCRSWFGFDPVGDEPGICKLDKPTPEPDDNRGWCKKTEQAHPFCESVCAPQCQWSSCIPCALP